MAAAAPTASAVSIRQRVPESTGRIKRVKALDRLATGVITFGGIFIIVAVSFIFVFIFGQALPLFQPAEGKARGPLTLAAVPSPAAASGAAPLGSVGGKPLAIGIDEYQLYLYEVRPEARVVFFKVADGSLAKDIPLAPVAGATITAASRSLSGDFIAAGTADGRVSLHQVRFLPKYGDQKLVDLDLQVRDRGLFEVDPAHGPVREVAYNEVEGKKAVAALMADDEIALIQISDEGI